MKLNYYQKMDIFERGYVRIPGVVPKIMIEEALKAINHTMGKGNVSPDYTGSNYFDQLANSPVITDLLRKSPAWSLIESLIGEGNLADYYGSQIALRFPTYEELPVKYTPHMDGILKVNEGLVENFTLLAGVLLRDVPEENMGNFTVYPGSHQLYEKYFKEKGPDILFTDESFSRQHYSDHVSLPDPVQITGNAGDLIISHYQLIHEGGPNISDQIRYATYYRVYHKDFTEDNWRSALTNLWMYLPGMQDILDGK
ncbi:hypothetical protein GCM10008014_39070 [Paenibacillus silvae]|uniref:Phytanoyl-CoA dioxygenase n=1 Tax=Paenibacillus silvae TaxID=1325358 RepID=A0ABQ1ZH35_9BACL|nr:phytanoyl-CoA dioxygenase family protein [Paenibacillus silvae]GGH62533.1 hypothetical protein GCM10008014_39070 [Paenibacillus silvae]